MRTCRASRQPRCSERFSDELEGVTQLVKLLGLGLGSYSIQVNQNSSNYNVEYRDGIKSKGDKIRMPCTHSTVI